MLPSQSAAPTSNGDLPPCATVVMPVFNEAVTVARMVENVLSQRPVQELIIVDDASADETWKILEALAGKEERVKIFRHDKTRAKARRYGRGFKRPRRQLC